MKTLLIILAALTSIQSCDDLKLIEGTAQEWAGGITGSPGGVYYNLSMVTFRSSAELKVDQLWINQDFYNVNGVKKLPALTKDGFVPNDTIYIRATKVNTVDNQKGVTLVPRPEGIKEEWIIGYEINGKRKYIGTTNVTVLKHISNP